MGGVGVAWGGAGFSGGSVDQMDPFTHHKETGVSLPWVLRLFGFCCNMEKIFSDEEVFEQIKPKSRKAFEKCWKELKEFKELNPEINFEEGPPGEELSLCLCLRLCLCRLGLSQSSGYGFCAYCEWNHCEFQNCS